MNQIRQITVLVKKLVDVIEDEDELMKFHSKILVSPM
jgi:hypothetical protein